VDVPLPEGRNLEAWSFGQLKDRSDPEFQNYYAHKMARYDGALRYIDEEIGRIVSSLKENGMYGDTLILVTSDHGEEFWDHAELGRELGGDPRKLWGIGHGHSLFQELLHVPLIVTGPGLSKDVIDCPTGLIDLPPTILESVGLPVPEFMRGRTLRRALLGSDSCPETPYIAEGIAYGPEARSVIWRGMKMIKRSDRVTLLFDLDTDPEERINLADQRPAVVLKLDRFYDETVNSRGTPSETEGLQMDEETLKQLRDLGYLN
jgi:arylsulfatase A-like enzyme